MFYPLKLAGRVDRAARVDENDTLQTKSALKVITALKKLCNHPALLWRMWREAQAEDRSQKVLPDSEGRPTPCIAVPDRLLDQVCDTDRWS